jgi:predicted metal-dependent phosphoesterase TrpH
VTAGVVEHRDEAFRLWLGSDSPYYVAHYAPDPVRAVKVVRAAGGVPVIAHPWSGTRGPAVDDALVEELVAAGLAGIEVYHRDHTPEAVRHLTALARALDLLRAHLHTGHTATEMGRDILTGVAHPGAEFENTVSGSEACVSAHVIEQRRTAVVGIDPAAV